MLTVGNLCKSYGINSVLNRISFALNAGARVGLVGINGVGKSTLLKILAGIENADSGKVSFASSVSVGYLPQSLPVFPNQTVAELLMDSLMELKLMENRMRQLEAEMAAEVGSNLDILLAEYSAVSTGFIKLDGYNISHRIEIVLAGLGLDYISRSQQVDTLSGGEKTRLSLAVLLLKNPDLLLLDEPTNNLDAASLAWLENYLSKYRGSVLMASHDRQFLKNTAATIFEIDEFSRWLKIYPGNYDVFKAAKEAERVKWEIAYLEQQTEIKDLKQTLKSTVNIANRQPKIRDNDKFIPGFKSGRMQKTDSRTIRLAQESLYRIEKDPIPKPPQPLSFKAGFEQQSMKSAQVIQAIGISRSFGEKTILNNISLTLSHKSRIVITGHNGAGKTTLLRILAAKDMPDTGSVTYSPGIRIGFLAQEPEATSLDISVLAYFGRNLPGNLNGFMHELLICGLFRFDDVEKKVSQLSLGQFRKLEIARLIACQPDILILDEPTNHISLDVMEVFETAINEFSGPVIAVSHDRRFIRQFGGEMWTIKDGQLAS
jgi:macrolide transport system ATP-binding/permease protein